MTIEHAAALAALYERLEVIAAQQSEIVAIMRRMAEPKAYRPQQMLPHVGSLQPRRGIPSVEF